MNEASVSRDPARRWDQDTPATDTRSQVFKTQGVVRGLKLSESDAAGEYASVRLAGDPSFYKDFDAPEDWEGLKGHRVSLSWYWSDGSNGLPYRVIVDVVDEGPP